MGIPSVVFHPARSSCRNYASVTHNVRAFYFVKIWNEEMPEGVQSDVIIFRQILCCLYRKLRRIMYTYRTYLYVLCIFVFVCWWFIQ